MTGLIVSLGGLGALVYMSRRIAQRTETGPPRHVSSPSGPVSLPLVRSAREIGASSPANDVAGAALRTKWQRPHP